MPSDLLYPIKARAGGAAGYKPRKKSKPAMNRGERSQLEALGYTVSTVQEDMKAEAARKKKRPKSAGY